MHLDIAMMGAQTRILGIIGGGISYTLSPLIHNISMKHLGINGVYLVFDIDHVEDLTPLLQTLRILKSPGFSVTKPYKNAIASLLGHAGPVNTVFFKNDRYEGANTDGIGFMRAIDRMQAGMAGQLQHVMMLGNGGAAQGLFTQLCQEQRALRFSIFRRNPNMDSWFFDRKGRHQLDFFDFEPALFSAKVAAAPLQSLLIQTTSAPINGDALERFAAALGSYQGAVVDITYRCRSALIEAARNRGLNCQDGLPMLIEQGLAAQQLWWGRCADYNEIQRVLMAEML